MTYRCLSELLQWKADIEAKTHGLTLQYYAVFNGHAALVKGLPEKKHNINAEDNSHKTSLHVAAENCHVDAVNADTDTD